MKKVHNTGEPMPTFFLGVGLIVVFFQHFFFQILSPPPPLPHMGFAVMNIGLTEACMAIDAPPFPPHGNLTKTPRGRQGNAKLIVRNKVFECTTLLKIEVIEYGKMGF